MNYTKDNKSIIKKEHSKAIAIQDSCNLWAVVSAFANALKVLNEAGVFRGTEDRNRNPITRLYASKLLSLAGELKPEDSSSPEDLWFDSLTKNELKELEEKYKLPFTSSYDSEVKFFLWEAAGFPPPQELIKIKEQPLIDMNDSYQLNGQWHPGCAREKS